MSVRLVDGDWENVFRKAAGHGGARLRIVCPFIKQRAIERLLSYTRPTSIEVVTRYSLRDFADGVSDIKSLRCLLDHGARIRGVRHLHAKLYLFGGTHAVSTSANLTDAALHRNSEVGVVIEDGDLLAAAHGYFERLWSIGGHDLSLAEVDSWDARVTSYRGSAAAHAAALATVDLADFGASAASPVAARSTEPGRSTTGSVKAFVKFFGTTTHRVSRSTPVVDQIISSGSHRFCTYPRAPRQVEDGSILYIAQLVEGNDILVYGRGVGMRHRPGDVASADDIRRRDWKAKWPYYVCMEEYPDFLAGSLGDGVSLNDLMDSMGARVFQTTRAHELAGTGNVNPRRAYLRQPQVELSREGHEELDRQFVEAFGKVGFIEASVVGALPEPPLPPV